MREFIAFPLEDTAEREREDPLEDSSGNYDHLRT